MAPDMKYTGEKPWDPLTLEVFPSGDSDFTLYSDDGTTYAYETGKSEITHLHWDNAASKLEHTGASAWSKPDEALVEIAGKAARD